MATLERTHTERPPLAPIPWAAMSAASPSNLRLALSDLDHALTLLHARLLDGECGTPNDRRYQADMLRKRREVALRALTEPIAVFQIGGEDAETYDCFAPPPGSYCPEHTYADTCQDPFEGIDLEQECARA